MSDFQYDSDLVTAFIKAAEQLNEHLDAVTYEVQTVDRAFPRAVMSAIEGARVAAAEFDMYVHERNMLAEMFGR